MTKTNRAKIEARTAEFEARINARITELEVKFEEFVEAVVKELQDVRGCMESD